MSIIFIYYRDTYKQIYGHRIYIKTYIPEFFVGFEFAYRMWLNDPENMHTNFSFSFI